MSDDTNLESRREFFGKIAKRAIQIGAIGAVASGAIALTLKSRTNQSKGPGACKKAGACADCPIAENCEIK